MSEWAIFVAGTGFGVALVFLVQLAVSLWDSRHE